MCGGLLRFARNDGGCFASLAMTALNDGAIKINKKRW